MTKAAVAKPKDEETGIFPRPVEGPALDKSKRIEILRLARDRLIEIRFRCAGDLAHPAKRGNTDLPVEELAKVQTAIDAIDKAIADERGLGSKSPRSP